MGSRLFVFQCSILRFSITKQPNESARKFWRRGLLLLRGWARRDDRDAQEITARTRYRPHVGIGDWYLTTETRTLQPRFLGDKKGVP